MKTYALKIGGKVMVDNAALSEYQAKKRFEQYQTKFKQYILHGSALGKEKSQADLDSMEIIEEPEVQTLEEAKFRLAIVIRSRQHFIDDIVKLRQQIQQTNVGWSKAHQNLVKEFNEKSQDHKYFITQMGEFILTKAQIDYVNSLSTIEDTVVTLATAGWMGGELYDLGKIVDSMMNNTYDPKQFGMPFSFEEYGFTE